MATNVNTNTALVQVDVQTSIKTVTLPTAVGYTGRLLTIKDKFGNCSNYNITISPQAGDTIDGSSSNYILSNAGAAVSLVSDGVSRWMTLNSPSQPFTGSTIFLSSSWVTVSTLGFYDPGTNQLSNLEMSSGRFLIQGNEIPVSQVLSLSSINLNFQTAIGSNVFTNSLYAVSGIISTLESSNIRAQNIITSTITANQFFGDGSRLSNLVLPSSSVITPQYALYTVESNTSYTGEPWGTQVMTLSTVATQLSPFYLTLNNTVLRVSTQNQQTFRISYMMGGNENTLTTPRPTITLALSTSSNVIYYPSIQNFEGGGGSVSFLEPLTEEANLIFYMRGLSNYTFTSEDANLYRMTFETVAGTSTDIFSTINVWTNYNRFVSTVDFDGAVNLFGTTNSCNLLASNITVNGSQTTTGDITGSNIIATASSIANSMFTEYLRVGQNSVIIQNNNILTSSIQVSTFSVLDQSTMTYNPLFISSGIIYFGSNVASAGGTGTGFGGSTLSSLFVGSRCNANFIKFWGSIGNYNDAVIAQQSTGGSTGEILMFKGSSIQDQLRFQTTGSVRFESGVSSRNYLNAGQVPTPSLFISTGTAVGLFTSQPEYNLDVIGTARFTTMMSSTAVYAGAFYGGLFFA
jgi:hypothetical protein